MKNYFIGGITVAEALELRRTLSQHQKHVAFGSPCSRRHYLVVINLEHHSIVYAIGMVHRWEKYATCVIFFAIVWKLHIWTLQFAPTMYDVIVSLVELIEASHSIRNRISRVLDFSHALVSSQYPPNTKHYTWNCIDKLFRPLPYMVLFCSMNEHEKYTHLLCICSVMSDFRDVYSTLHVTDYTQCTGTTDVQSIAYCTNGKEWRAPINRDQCER